MANNTYKSYELSMSLYPDGKILHIARSLSGGVGFRETSLEKLKKSIDAHVDKRQKEKERLIKEKAKASKTKKEKKGLFVVPSKQQTEELESLNTVPNNTETDSDKNKKFLENKLREQIQEAKANSQAENTLETVPSTETTENKPKKKNFWDRLR